MLKNKILPFTASVVAYKALCDYFYINFVAELFFYDGYYVNINYFKYIETYLLIIFSAGILYASLRNYTGPSKIILYIFYLNLIIPLISIYALEDQSRVYIYTILLGFLLTLSLTRTRKVRLPAVQNGKLLLTVFFALMTTYVYGYLIATGGLSRMNFDLSLVYETRAQYSSTANGLSSYLIPWQAYGVNNMIIALGIIFRKRFLLLLGLGLQLLLFGMIGQKSFLFAPVLVIFLSYFLKKKFIYNNIMTLIAIGFSVITLLGFLHYKFTSDPLMGSIFIRRLLFTPAKLHYIYYDYFSEMPKMYLSHSFFSSFAENSYGVGPVEVIANQIYGRDFSPNVGFYGDAYLNFGLGGILFYSIILGMILKLLDGISLGLPKNISITIVIIPFMAMLNSALPTSLATHGILFSLFCLWILSGILKQYKPVIEMNGGFGK
ncbi:O-antigen polymerase [Cytobacillus firmus]|uniref:O-antigen polymerase n=1 Tax=Cytobacillus firmus TaxID=1399 RepID=UPI0018CE952B|nr:O-antigen polymerase [Cytobacillus firmus]MBG9586547.1 hypothetical protein [Cytobacillus firmus]